MSGPNELPKGYNRYRDALHIVDPGACNPIRHRARAS